MKSYIIIAVLATIAIGELVCCLKERQWRVAAENRLAETTATVARHQEANQSQQSRIEALQAELEAQQAKLESIGKQNREVLDQYVATALKLKTAEAELAKSKTAKAEPAKTKAAKAEPAKTKAAKPRSAKGSR